MRSSTADNADFADVLSECPNLKVAQVFNLQGVRTGDLIASNRAFWSVESSEISRPASGLQDENLRYAFGLTFTIEPSETTRQTPKPTWYKKN
jgi:hypothetical protein